MFGMKDELKEIKELLFEIRTILEMQTDFVTERAEQAEVNNILWHENQIKYLESIRDAKKKKEEEVSEEFRQGCINRRNEKERQEALEELTKQSQELGLYDSDDIHEDKDGY